MPIDVHWRYIIGPSDEAWRWSRVLYAYLHPQQDELLYVGKSWGTTVRSRWSASHKVEGVFAHLDEIGLRQHRVVVGDLSFDGRLTHQLLSDVESLIIFATQPVANVACRTSRISRPGLIVRNRGAAWCGPPELRDVAT